MTKLPFAFELNLGDAPATTRIAPTRQSKTMSFVETLTNVVVGYVLAILTQIIVFPVFGLRAGFGEHLAIGLAFVGVSLVRGYVLRRAFETLRLRKK